MNRSAEEKIKDIVRHAIKTEPRPYAEKYGHDWCDLSEEEAYIFRLELRDLPILVNVWAAFLDIIDIWDMARIPLELCEQFRKDNPWLKKRSMEEDEWLKFSEIFNLSRRKSKAWYWKNYFREVRMGLVIYRDEER